ncbi:rhomboid family intramembrane serine protease [Candidatus Woesearchaeota archaeon]|nr:rhomboid family intramembrane serine protease [Candidatus Woesearchaeota archaeon]
MKFRNIVISLIAVNIIIFILQMILGINFTEAFMLISADIFKRPWILLTSMFLHGDLNHLLFNMYALFLFGILLEQKIGAKKFAFIYFLTGIIAAFMAGFFYPRALGASGAVMGIIGALIILMPNLRLLFLFAVPMPLWVAGIIWILIDLLGIFVPSGIANIAHLAGIGSGLLIGLYFKRQRKVYQKKFSSKTHMDTEDIEEYFKTGRI